MVRRQEQPLPYVHKEPGLRNLERAHTWASRANARVGTIVRRLEVLLDAYVNPDYKGQYAEEAAIVVEVKDVALASRAFAKNNVLLLFDIIKLFTKMYEDRVVVDRRFPDPRNIPRPERVGEVDANETEDEDTTGSSEDDDEAEREPMGIDKDEGNNGDSGDSDDSRHSEQDSLLPETYYTLAEFVTPMYRRQRSHEAFPQFARLPRELQLMVWERAPTPPPCLHFFMSQHPHLGGVNDAEAIFLPDNGLWLACKDARKEMRRQYTDALNQAMWHGCTYDITSPEDLAFQELRKFRGDCMRLWTRLRAQWRRLGRLRERLLMAARKLRKRTLYLDNGQTSVEFFVRSIRLVPMQNMELILGSLRYGFVG
ncbi:hypothetical protein SCUCBS95973_004057 [Sporothrix curviconia]|uniref:2EXR domain-containing protein n=1 Tax=Sporothrix curviconia TaxID=1260050 RepID=A0ABP0BLP7_9PEZI